MDPEELRPKRSEHEQRLSKVFDEVMGLGEFAENSRGSSSSSSTTTISSGSMAWLRPKEAEQSCVQPERMEMEEEKKGDHGDESGREKPVGKGEDEAPCVGAATTITGAATTITTAAATTTSSSSSSSPPDQHSHLLTAAGGERGSGDTDDKLKGLPAMAPVGEEEEEAEEPWHFSLPMAGLEDTDAGNTYGKSSPSRPEKGKKERRDGQGQPEEGKKETRDDQGQLEEGKKETRDDQGQPKEGKKEIRGDQGQPEERKKETKVDPVAAGQEEEKRGKEPERGLSEPASAPSQEGGVPSQREEPKKSQTEERSDPAPPEKPPVSPIANIKDEPIDEGYDAALLPHNSISKIKEELEHHEEELRISSVYSVGGGNTFAPSSVASLVQAPQATAIFIPGRGSLLQAAVAPLALRPPMAPVPGAFPAMATVRQPLQQPHPPPPMTPGTIRCSGCSKVLVKGQTAFQRKGSTQLFCSTVCLSGHLPPSSKARTCYQCTKEITSPKDMIMVPVDANHYMHFCSHFCLSLSKHKKKALEKPVEKRPEKRPEKPPEKPHCSICKSTKRIEHEVTHHGSLYRLCSDTCFLTWRKSRQLAMNCCEGCGLYCKSDSDACHTLTVDQSQVNFCSSTCISTYKQTCRKMTECAKCHNSVTVSTTTMERDVKGKVQLYCSDACVELSRPATHTLIGTPFPCAYCGNNAVPQYHLAMVDGNIRNFCSYDCVSTFRLQKFGNISRPNRTNGSIPPPSSSPSSSSSSSPYIIQRPSGGTVPDTILGPPKLPSPLAYSDGHPGTTSLAPVVPPHRSLSSPADLALALAPGRVLSPALTHGYVRLPLAQPPKCQAMEPLRLTCHQCSKKFESKPLLFGYQGRISMFCDTACCELYKSQKNTTAPCASCKLDKVVHEVITYDEQDTAFCSQSCKQLFKEQGMSRDEGWTWRPCTYCSSISRKTLHSHYSGKMEEFCKPHCMSQYTVLYYGMARCDSCRKQGYMAEKLQCSDSVCNFCALPCLLRYCYQHFEDSQRLSNGTGSGPALLAPHAPIQPHVSSKMNPVIADVVSLASASATQPDQTGDSALSGSLPTSNTHDRNLDNASTQTDGTRSPVLRRCSMKNKSVMCRPFTLDQETMCQLPESPGSKANRAQTN